MLDLKFIREHPEQIREAAQRKRLQIPLDELLQADREHRELLAQVEALRHEQKQGSKKVSAAKNKDERESLLVQMKELSQKVKELETVCNSKANLVRDLQLRIPNVPAPDVPVGASDADNKPVKHWGEVPKFRFPAKDHLALGEQLDLLDMTRAANISGTRNYFLKREAVFMEQAVLRLALEHMVNKGFIPLSVPLLVREKAMVGTAYFPGGEEQAYRIEKDELSLIGTSEVPLTSFHEGEILNVDDLPKRYVALSSCFRREAGTYGKDTKGLYRVHQFMKVEQVVIDVADGQRSEEHHERITRNAEEILEALQLPYRRVLVCGGDLGAAQVKKFDLETWMPSRENYGETHSASQFHDYQARRLNMRYRDKDGKVRFCFTLNNTVIASPRILIAIFENYQQQDGSIVVPQVLRPHMNGLEVIRR